ncbi:hypothetical protein UAY_01031 [Enterococcus moraviensis ATCC BAA-383]|uniref:Uncharacterized protein n=1 Tax=Enterococcus moraviensis ATCC BAA-383 TaxID=1158609 RepID=R2T2I9_9ENTE|nr:hypothetical protein [Enterococcus moraviensis]EOI01623.1 hypothetical protein UAY_01031 [Enterococcus moraviensis ATCC BAA-383]EOT73842.1 hypothetical protein I586_00836 [Enterococcus moraviensis ATCC BAA-383]OJG65162.1 hypothetical protein RV09_GL001323 [Enterococcus moraviensis]
MKRKVLVFGLFLGMIMTSFFIAGYIKKNYAHTIYQALKFSGIGSEQIVFQQEEKDHIDVFLADGSNLKIVIMKAKESNGRKNYEIIQTSEWEDFFSDEETSISDTDAIKNQLEMMRSIENVPFYSDKEIHKSFGESLFFIRSTRSKEIKNLKINGQRPTNIFTYNYKGVVNYVYYYEELKLEHDKVKVRI